MTRRFPILAAALLMCLALGGCKTSQSNPFTRPLDGALGHRGESEARLSTAAAAAIAEGKADEALDKYQTLHLHHPNNPEIAVNYAQLLRKTGKADKASDILSGFVLTKNGHPLEDADPLVLNEYAASRIALGDFAGAEKTLDRVLEDEKAKKFHNDAWNLMGVALDARGQHKEAEEMFRQALDGWKGDPTSVMNNLALCLASEGMFDESLSTLRRALVMAPGNEEIAHNIQLVEQLRDAVVSKAPVDLKKNKTKKKK